MGLSDGERREISTHGGEIGQGAGVALDRK